MDTGNEQIAELNEKPGARNLARRNLIFGLLSLLVALSLPVSAILGSLSSFGRVSDFPEYYAAARLAADGRGADIYSLDHLFKTEHDFFPAMEGRGLGYYIPPFATPLLMPFGLLPPREAYTFFLSGLLFCLIAASLVLGRHFALSPAGRIWLFVLIISSGPVFESLKIGQLSPFLFAAAALFLHFSARQKDFAAGACLAVLLCKPQELLPLVVYLLGAGRSKILLSLFSIFLALAACSYVILGADAYQNYFELLKDSVAQTQFMQPELSATIRGQLLRLFGTSDSLANVISMLALALALSLIFFAGKLIGRGRGFEQGLLCVALPLGLLTALHCHDYDLLLLTPWFLYLWKYAGRGLAESASKISAGMLLLCSMVPVYIPLHYQWLLRGRQLLNPLFLLFALAAFMSCRLCLLSMSQDEQS